MSTAQIISLIITVLLSSGAFVIAARQAKGKGILFNNAYIYASVDERDRMNKTPHYKQSAVVFMSLGIILAMTALNIILSRRWLSFVIIGATVFLIVYAIISSIYIEKKYEKNLK